LFGFNDISRVFHHSGESFGHEDLLSRSYREVPGLLQKRVLTFLFDLVVKNHKVIDEMWIENFKSN